jgi:hypothetical protein
MKFLKFIGKIICFMCVFLIAFILIVNAINLIGVSWKGSVVEKYEVWKPGPETKEVNFYEFESYKNKTFVRQTFDLHFPFLKEMKDHISVYAVDFALNGSNPYIAYHALVDDLFLVKSVTELPPPKHTKRPWILVYETEDSYFKDNLLMVDWKPRHDLIFVFSGVLFIISAGLLFAMICVGRIIGEDLCCFMEPVTRRVFYG